MHDYIIVGAGSAGCVLANRLSEDPKTTILILEAGGTDRAREIRIPVAFSKLFKSAFDWAYETEEQVHLRSRKLYWPRGKVLGGSSSINAMVYIRGSRHDYDSWAQLGNPGWSFSDVLPYFKKSEDQERDATAYHGVGGPLRVEDLREVNPLSRAFIEACVEIGLPRNADFNGREQEGVGFYQVTQKRGRRHSAADAYLRPALRRPNLVVRLHAHATRLLFEGRRVTGVEYLRDGKTCQAAAQRGVILCGGTVNSPQLLMLSGLGPAAQLQSLGIPVVMDLPGVGENLQDHLIVALACACTQAVGLEEAECFSNSMRYLFLRKGPLTSNVAEAGGFIRTRRELPAADLQVVFGPLYYLNHGLTRPDSHGLSIGSALIRPESRGRIRLRSSNPLEPPAIEPDYLSSEADLRVLIEGLKLARRISRAKAFRACCGQETHPGAQVKTDEAIAEYIRQSSETLYHPVGTCKMGKDALSVVNARLQVHGLDGLRVVDASIMPGIVGGNTNAPTIMIAEKAADLIKQSA